MRLVQSWTLGDGDRQRDGVIGGRRWQRTKGQWVKLFLSPPAHSLSEKLQIRQMELQTKCFLKMQSANFLSRNINFAAFHIWFVYVHTALLILFVTFIDKLRGMEAWWTLPFCWRCSSFCFIGPLPIMHTVVKCEEVWGHSTLASCWELLLQMKNFKYLDLLRWTETDPLTLFYRIGDCCYLLYGS